MGRQEEIDRIHDILLNDPRCWTKDEKGGAIVSFDGQAEALVDEGFGFKDRFEIEEEPHKNGMRYIIPIDYKENNG